jgi:hypothetical protein
MIPLFYRRKLPDTEAGLSVKKTARQRVHAEIRDTILSSDELDLLWAHLASYSNEDNDDDKVVYSVPLKPRN